MNKKVKLGLVFGGLILLAIVSAKFGWAALTPETIRDFIRSFGWMAPVFYVLLYTIRPLFLFPAVILSITGGLTFGPWWGTFLDLIGATLGSYLAFWISRKVGRETIQKWMGPRLKLWDHRFEHQGFKAILVLRLIPLIPFDAVNYGAGLSKVRFRDYAIATPIGIVPGAFAYNYLGHSLHKIFSVPFYVAIVLVILLAVVPLFFKRKKQGESKLNYRVEQQK